MSMDVNDNDEKVLEQAEEMESVEGEGGSSLVGKVISREIKVEPGKAPVSSVDSSTRPPVTDSVDRMIEEQAKRIAPDQTGGWGTSGGK